MMTKPCETCNGSGVLVSGEMKQTCYSCKGVGRRKLKDLDFLIAHPRMGKD